MQNPCIPGAWLPWLAYRTDRPKGPTIMGPAIRDTCNSCGTVNPHGGLIVRWQNGEPEGVLCAYRFGCTPGVQRPENG